MNKQSINTINTISTISTKSTKKAIITAIVSILTISSMALDSSSQSTRAAAFSGGAGTESSPYLISTPADLVTLSSLINDPATNPSFANRHYVLTSNIDLSGHDDWTPVGTGLIRADGQDNRLTFRGVFDGGGKKITSLKITHADRFADSFQGSGLFGVVDGGTVKNLGLDGVNINIDAGVAGGVVGAVIAGGVITDCYVVGDISGVGSIGGIAGHIDDNSMIVNNYVVGNVSGIDRVGGIVGHVYNGYITNSRIAGHVRFDGRLAAVIAGHVWNGVITDSEIFDPDTDIEKILASIPPHLLSGVVAGVPAYPAVVAVMGGSGGGVITVGPNPVDRQSRAVGFFRYGEKIRSGRLSVYNSAGHAIKKIAIVDNSAIADDLGWRRVGSWDLRDRRGRPIPADNYIARGVVVLSNGAKERVSIVLSVR